MAALVDGARGALAVAASPVPGEAVLPALLPRFRAAHPDTTVRLAIGDAWAQVERLLRREVELALIGSPFRDERCLAEIVARDEFALIAPGDHPLARNGAVTAARLAQEPLVLREEGSGARAAVESAFARVGIAPERISVAAELGSTEAVKAAVAAGLGVGFVSVCALVAGGPAGALRALPMVDFAPARDLLLVSERGRPLSTLATAFRAFLLSDDVRREIAATTRLPARLRAATPPRDPLLAGGPIRVARPARSADEERVAGLLARRPSCTREGLVAALADELRRAEADPFGGPAELGSWRLGLYRQSADRVVATLLGDFLVEERPSP
jgi:DNA-binding transcriptional LysR family regulator